MASFENLSEVLESPVSYCFVHRLIVSYGDSVLFSDIFKSNLHMNLLSFQHRKYDIHIIQYINDFSYSGIFLFNNSMENPTKPNFHDKLFFPHFFLNMTDTKIIYVYFSHQ